MTTLHATFRMHENSSVGTGNPVKNFPKKPELATKCQDWQLKSHIPI
jgi:hypothetical protein